MARAKQNLKEMKKRAIDEVASCYLKEKVKNGGKVPNGAFKTVVHKVLDAFNIPGARLDINQHTILSRIGRQSLQVNSRGVKSPMEEVEPVIYEFAPWKQEAGQPVSSGEGIVLATSLIKNTPLERKVQAFQASQYGKDTWRLTNLYWQGFMRRHAESLSLAKGNRVAACQSEWTTYENVLEMYSLVYEQMVDAGVARNLPVEESFWTNDSGEIVETEAEASGCKIDVDIKHLEWICSGDKVGTDINQKDDGHIGGTQYCVGHGTKANIKSSTNGGRFTLIGLTAASGDAVMCIIIFAAEELSYGQRMGHDIKADCNIEGSVRDNSGPGKAGAPTCQFWGKDVPALIACSPKGSITSDILKEILKRTGRPWDP
jgi:hypothetical protein